MFSVRMWGLFPLNMWKQLDDIQFACVHLKIFSSPFNSILWMKLESLKQGFEGIFKMMDPFDFYSMFLVNMP